MDDDGGAPDVTSLLEQSLEGAAAAETAPEPAEVSTASDAAATTTTTAAAAADVESTPADGAEAGDAAPSPPAEASAPAPTAPQVCAVCEQQPGKYKCPRCRILYCSVACSRTHRDNHPPDPPPPEKPAGGPEPQQPATAPPAKRHPFSVLDDSPELRRLFARYPNLPSALARVHAATLPPGPGGPQQQQQQQPRGGGGGGGGGAGLPWSLQQTAAYRGRQPAWTQDVGLRRGKDALRRARTDPGADGEAVREYCELVLHLLARQEREDEGRDATALVRQEVDEEERRLIERLMEAEGA